MTALRVNVLLVIALATFPLLAAETSPVIVISRGPMDDFTSAIDLRIYVTSKPHIRVSKISVWLPAAYVQQGRDPDDNNVELEHKIEIRPDLDRTYSRHFDGLPWYSGLWLISSQKPLDPKILDAEALDGITLDGKTSDGIVTVEYHDEGSSVNKICKRVFPLPADAPLCAVFLGGIAGVLTWFLMAWALKKQLTFRGALVAIVITLLALACARLTTTNFIPLPVSVDLKDSFAGLLVGLAWPTTQKAIMSKLFPVLA